MSALAITAHDPQPSPFHKGFAPKYHARLKHDGRTLAVLQGDTCSAFSFRPFAARQIAGTSEFS